MSSAVLARKYRPRSFAEMVGQPHVVQALTHALQQGRLHHAYLFTGTRGIGKTTVSRILAKSLNCSGPDGSGGVTATPCGVCQACTEIDADRYLDYIELDAASNRGIGEVQDLIERAAYKPGLGRYKVFMIDEAHQLTKDAFNALLKTLEEPPEYLKFVLATTDPEKMLPTVLSRCLQFNLRPMAPEMVREHLATVLKAEGVAHDEGSLRLLARAARGSMRDGLSLADQAIAYGAGRLAEDQVRAMLGSVDGSVPARIVQALAARDAAAALAAVDALREAGQSAAGTLEALAQLLQRMAVAQAVPEALDAGDPDLDDARALAGALAPDETQLLYSMALHGRDELHLMGDEYGALGMVLLRWLAFAGGIAASAPRSAPLRRPLSQPPARAEVPLRRAGMPASPADAQERAAAPTPAPVAHEPAAPGHEAAPQRHAGPAGGAAEQLASELGDRWAALVRQLVAEGRVAALVRELATQGGLVAADDTLQPPRWSLQVERETLRTPALRDKLAAALAEVLGHAVMLELLPGTPTDTPAQRAAAQRRRRQAQAEALIQDDPVVRALLAQFDGARIVPGSIRPVDGADEAGR